MQEANLCLGNAFRLKAQEHPPLGKIMAGLGQLTSLSVLQTSLEDTLRYILFTHGAHFHTMRVYLDNQNIPRPGYRPKPQEVFD